MIRAVIFDFDGLVIDTESPILQAWQELFQEHGQELGLEEWAVNVGRENVFDPLPHLETLIGRSLDRDAVTARRRARQTELVESQPILPGVEARIAEAQALGLKLGVASSSSRAWVEGHLTRLGLIERFHAVRSWDHPEVRARKPDPAVYLAALRALGVDGGEAIAIEDSFNGVLSAARAGIFTVAIPNDVTRAMGETGADITLESLEATTIEQLVSAASERTRSPA